MYKRTIAVPGLQAGVKL